MLDQIYKIQKWSQERVHNVVVMGTGEPLDNYDSLLRFIHLLTDEGGLHISQRNLTVSTCGIVPNMRRLADEKLQITLALSLHASSQEKRKTLMPVAYKFDLKDVLDADLYEKLKDDIDGDRLDLSNSTKWKETGMTGYEPAYLTIVSSGKHLENTVKFIEYLYE